MAAGIPLVPTHPVDPYASTLQGMRRDYPLLANIPITVGENRQGEYQSEVFMPWQQDNPTPNQFHIELRHFLDRPQTPEDLRRALTGETFHYLGTKNPATGQPINPQWYGLKQQVIQQMAPNDLRNAQRNYANAVKTGGETRTFDQWMEDSAIDQFIGGTMFPPSTEPEWVNRSRDIWRYAPKQAATIERMRQLLTTGR